MRKLLLLLPLVLLPATGHAELYKWTDENGRVQFSDQKPVNRSNVEKMATPSALSTSGTTATHNAEKSGSGESLLERQRKISDVLRAEREQREAAAKKIAEQKAEKKRRCIEMTDFQKNTESAVLYHLDEKGERKFMGDAEKEKYQADLQRRIQEACQP